jgi:hypothetical protein
VGWIRGKAVKRLLLDVRCLDVMHVRNARSCRIHARLLVCLPYFDVSEGWGLGRVTSSSGSSGGVQMRQGLPNGGGMYISVYIVACLYGLTEVR